MSSRFYVQSSSSRAPRPAHRAGALDPRQFLKITGAPWTRGALAPRRTAGTAGALDPRGTLGALDPRPAALEISSLELPGASVREVAIEKSLSVPLKYAV